VTVQPAKGTEGKAVTGELVTVDAEHVWVRDANGVHAVPLATVGTVRVERHPSPGGGSSAGA